MQDRCAHNRDGCQQVTGSGDSLCAFEYDGSHRAPIHTKMKNTRARIMANDIQTPKGYRHWLQADIGI